MKHSIDITHIRRLLDKFYRGATTPSEEAVLYDFFCQENAAAIPADLTAHIKVFATLSDAAKVGRHSVPTNLLNEIKSRIDYEPDRKPGRRHKYLLIAITGVAAACIIFAVVNFMPRLANDSRPAQLRQNEVIASRATIDLSHISAHTPQADGYIEITDPDEARLILSQLNGLLASNVTETDRAINAISTSINIHKHITKHVLQ